MMIVLDICYIYGFIDYVYLLKSKWITSVCFSFAHCQIQKSYDDHTQKQKQQYIFFYTTIGIFYSNVIKFTKIKINGCSQIYTVLYFKKKGMMYATLQDILCSFLLSTMRFLMKHQCSQFLAGLTTHFLTNLLTNLCCQFKKTRSTFQSIELSGINIVVLSPRHFS